MKPLHVWWEAMKNLATGNLTPVIALLTVGMVATYFILISVSTVNKTKEQVEENTRGLQTVLKEEAFPKSSRTRQFLYLYWPQTEIEIDGNMEDWKATHDAAVEKGDLPPTDDRSHSWLDSSFLKVKEEEYARFITPYDDGNVMRVPGRQDGGRLGTIEKVPDLRLRFARGKNESLYILGHVVNVGPGKSISLRLTVHQDKSEDQTFTFFPEKEGSLKIYGTIPSETKRQNIEVLPEKAQGKWWESGQDEFFELALHPVRDSDAVSLAAVVYEGDDVFFGPDPRDQEPEPQHPQALFLLGPESPLPLEEAIKAYPIASLLRQLFRHDYDYEVSRGGHKLLSSDPEAADKRSDTRLPWLLKPVYRLSLFLNSIRPCSREKGGVCFLDTERGGYQLRMARPLREMAGSSMQPPAKSGQQGDAAATIVRTTEPLVISFPGMGLVVPVIVSLNFLLALAIRSRKHAHERLEQSHNDLEQTNEALKSYDRLFIHQAGNYLVEANDNVCKLTDSTDAAVRNKCREEIGRLIGYAQAHLKTSTAIFNYDALVAEEIAKHKEYGGFDLYDSVAAIVERCKDNRVELDPPQWTGRRPFLDATGPGKTRIQSKETEKDIHFVEVMDTIIQNAIGYRRPANSTITLSLKVEQEWAVLRVFNQGPTVPENKQEAVFDLGTRYAGTEEDGSSAPASQNEEKHLGLGLFRVSQIVRAYRGSRRLDNLDDGSGVVVTVRLPVAFSD